MGATTFRNTVAGKTAAEAFKTAGECARHEYGHRGYTGTIAEKSDFTMITVPTTFVAADRKGEALTGDARLRAYADHLINEDDPRVCDKWGPAGCIALSEGRFLFFGWASE